MGINETFKVFKGAWWAYYELKRRQPKIPREERSTTRRVRRCDKKEHMALGQMLLSVGWRSPPEGTPPTAPPHEGGERKKTEQKQDHVCKRPHIALPPNEILQSEELEGSTRTCRNGQKKRHRRKKGRRMHKSATASDPTCRKHTVGNRIDQE